MVKAPCARCQVVFRLEELHKPPSGVAIKTLVCLDCWIALKGEVQAKAAARKAARKGQGGA